LPRLTFSRRRLGPGTCNVFVRARPPSVGGIGERVPDRRGQGVRPGRGKKRTGDRPLVEGRRVPWPWPLLRLERVGRSRSREPHFRSDFYPRGWNCKPAAPGRQRATGESAQPLALVPEGSGSSAMPVGQSAPQRQPPLTRHGRSHEALPHPNGQKTRDLGPGGYRTPSASAVPGPPLSLRPGLAVA
jgi:hypothetical protein